MTDPVSAVYSRRNITSVTAIDGCSCWMDEDTLDREIRALYASPEASRCARTFLFWSIKRQTLHQSPGEPRTRCGCADGQRWIISGRTNTVRRNVMREISMVIVDKQAVKLSLGKEMDRCDRLRRRGILGS